MRLINDTIENNRRGGGLGLFSICSALPEAIVSGLNVSRETGCPAVIESTSNQVDQNGGYTGMTPEKFAGWVYSLAEELGVNRGQIILGGDHLGPNGWKDEPEASAMKKAEILVRDCIKAGYRKIHLDASMMLADDTSLSNGSLPDEIVARRAARLCSACEDEWKKDGGGESPAPVYIIGTEVPVPGGVESEDEGPEVTEPDDAVNTIEVTKAIFRENGLESAWERVVGLVVQPGVEFGDTEIHDYKSKKAVGLSSVIENYQGMIFEAHSTDYQTAKGLRELVEDHFAILKVGPWLTYAYREALFLLHEIEKELFADKMHESSRIREVLWRTMAENPKHWKKYYHGTIEELKYKAFFSLSDRMRYYWTEKAISDSLTLLYANLNEKGIPLTLLSQFFPEEYNMVREGRLKNTPDQLVNNRLSKITKMYSGACGF